MQKLTSILAVLETQADGGFVLRKAMELARHFDARLQLLAIEPLQGARVVRHCAALGFPDVTVRVASRLGRRLHSVVAECVEQGNADLVLKARAGRHPLRRLSLTPNDWRLSQDCPVPLMLVGARPWSSPIRFAAAVDVSDRETLGVARSILQTAGFLALGCHGNLDILYTERERDDEALRMERAVTLAGLVREFHVGCERLQMFDGIPEKRLPPLIAARQYDVLLLGSVTHRGGLAEAICPITGSLLEATAGDVVLVNPRAAERREPRPAGASRGDQTPHQGQQFV